MNTVTTGEELYLTSMVRVALEAFTTDPEILFVQRESYALSPVLHV
jgi:hypothetical protein